MWIANIFYLLYSFCCKSHNWNDIFDFFFFLVAPSTMQKFQNPTWSIYKEAETKRFFLMLSLSSNFGWSSRFLVFYRWGMSVLKPQKISGEPRDLVANIFLFRSVFFKLFCQCKVECLLISLAVLSSSLLILDSTYLLCNAIAITKNKTGE